ncbi:MAG: HEAT repeat domain-containing protein [Myxococcota bacterium]
MLARPAATVLAGAVAAVFACTAARAHIVVDVPSLYRLVSGADLVVRAKIVGGSALGPATERRPVTRALVLETLVGEAAVGSSVVFAAHGHGVATYAEGEEALLFLRAAERNRELGGLAEAGLRWVSLQEHDEKVLLEEGSGATRVAAARAYAGIPRAASAEERRAALARQTLRNLGSSDPQLALWALSDLTLAGDAFPLTPADLARLRSRALDVESSIGLRLALLAELERRGVDDTNTQWLAILQNSQGTERVAVVRAARAHSSPPVTRALFGLLEDPDLAAAEAAAVSLGVPGNEAAVDGLAAMLASPEPRLRMAAIRGLGRIGTPGASAALEDGARTHSDPATRRRAQAELRVLEWNAAP